MVGLQGPSDQDRSFRAVFEDALRRAVAEFIGTFTLLFIGIGSIVAANQIHDPSLIGVAIAHGLAIGVMVSAVGHISGAHFNPAVTFGFLITRRIKPALGLLYWAAQLAGAALATLLIRDLLPRASTDPVHLGVPALGGGVNAGAAFGLEAIMTFFLSWGVCLARHGQTAYNLEGRFQGQLPVPLDDTGRAQAAELAERAAAHGFAALWCSPLLRARETADIVARRIGLQPREDARLMETDAGDWTDRSFAEVHAEGARAVRRVRRRRSGLRVPRRRVLRRAGGARRARRSTTSNRASCPRSSSATAWSSAPRAHAAPGIG